MRQRVRESKGKIDRKVAVTRTAIRSGLHLTLKKDGVQERNRRRVERKTGGDC